MKYLPLLLLLWLLLIPKFNLCAQNAEPEVEIDNATIYTIKAYRLNENENFRLDGLMNEPFWDKITPASNFTQREPSEGADPSQRSEVYIAYDNNYLYIGAKLYDSEPDRILAWQKRRNQRLDTDDNFQLILDTFHDGRNAYFFETNPAAVRGDGLVTMSQGRNLNKDWDGIWNVRTSVNNEGWVVEMQIPFSTLDFNSNQSTWGINFQRTIRRNNEEVAWSGWRRHQSLFRPQDAGFLTDLEGLSQGLGLEIDPFMTGNADRTWPDSGSPNNSVGADAGLDITYSITPSIRTSLTLNTDFAETEVDQRQVNLTRFPLRFPEQRDFFLEGSGIFEFAPRSGFDAFFSRRIGLVDGNPIPIQGGVRLLGREGNTNMGLYQIRTGSTDITNREDFSVARISQNIFSESNIGFIYTRRATLGDNIFTNRHTLGYDMELSTSNFLGDKNLQFQSFFVWHNTNTIEETSNFWDRTGRGFRINYPNFPFSSSMSYREFGSSFDPALGFIRRNGLRRLQPSAGYEYVFSDNRLLRTWEVQLRYEHQTDLDFRPQDVNLRLTFVDIEFESGEEFEMSITRDFERLRSDFDVLRNGRFIIPAGDYYTWQFNSEFSTASHRRFVLETEYTREGFFNGTGNTYELTGTFRPFPGINLSTDWIHNRVNLKEQGSFSTDLFRFNGNFDLSPNFAITSILQFDNVSDRLGLFQRLRWTITPGSDLFLVLNYNWIQMENRFEPVEVQGAAKINYTHRF